ncbi:MFS transporter [Streptomyces sp. NPDC051677]|uniref:MFS transporter n=1 Tax=Streptomyces sp. NPDC051677 TaxID=3365669 RepID=UPI0037D27426
MSPEHGQAASTRDRSARQVNILVVVLTFTGIVATLLNTLIIPVIPHLPRYLNAPVSDTAWALTVTLLCGAVTTPMMGRLADMYGKRRMLLLGIGLLALGSVVCALSDTLAPLLVGRALQGMAHGVIPLCLSIMRDEVPAERLPVAAAVMAGSLGVGGAVGLPTAALIADNFHWHVLFWTAAGCSVVSLVLILLLVPKSKVRTGGSFDFPGALGLTVGLVCLLLAASKGEDWGWRSATTLLLFTATVVVLPLWGWYELRTPQPVVDLRSSARPLVLFTNLAAVALGLSLFATNLVIPQVLQLPRATGYGLGKSLVVTGLALAPQGLAMMAFSPLAARITKAKSPKLTLVIGAAITGAGYLLAMVMMSGMWQLIMASCVIAAGVGFCLGALPTLIMGAVPVSETAAANGLNSLMRSIGTTSSSAAAGVILAHMTISFADAQVPSENGLRTVLAVGAGAAAVVLAIATFIPGGRSAAAPSPQVPVETTT